MKERKIRKPWVVFLAVGMVLLSWSLPAQNPPYLLETGRPTFTTPEPVPMGFINLANGNLHIEIPVATVPQRSGKPFVAMMVYDSRIWKIVDNGFEVFWSSDNIPGSTFGWRFVTTGKETSGYEQTTQTCAGPEGPLNWYENKNHRFHDIDGTVRRFPTYSSTTNACHTGETFTYPAPALDASGFAMISTGTFAPNGSRVLGIKDANGNFMDQDTSGNVKDTLDRTVVQKTVVSSTITDYTILNSGFSGGSVYYRLTYTGGGIGSGGIIINTNFGYPDAAECCGPLPQNALKEIQLPNGSKYQFTYDSHGLLSTMTLPTGATISFAHDNYWFQGGRNRWAISMSTGAGGGTWTYAPSFCGASCNKVTVTRPSGDETIYTFAIDSARNGAWNTLTESYTGSAQTGTLALKVQREYTGNPHPVNAGDAFTRSFRSTTTIPGPSGDLVTKTETDYDTFTYTYRGANYTGSRGNAVENREFAYGNAAPGALVRKHRFSYLHDATPAYLASNIVNRVTNAQTLDPADTKVAETITTYDSTTLTAPGQSITHHDATNYGTGNTLRGNPTVIQRWVGTGSAPGPAYLTTTLDYDTTGQVIKATDPRGTTTTFSYTNNFYKDVGQPPLSYSPSPPPTNAYPTQVTLPLSGTINMGYYYGSGNRALVTDQNSQTTYSHYLDHFDRLTSTRLPRGGTSSIQHALTQVNYLSSITETTTRDDQGDLDSLGRLATQSLQTDPEGVSYGDVTYDSSGRVQSVVKAYRPGETNYGFQSLLYDGLNRKKRVSYGDGNMQEVFYGPEVTAPGVGGIGTQLCSPATYGLGYPVLAKDETGRKRQTWTDAFGRIIEADEPDPNGALTLATCYKYGILGNLIQVDQGAQTRTWGYDALSRLRVETTPEGGTVGYMYSYLSGALCAGDPKAICLKTDCAGHYHRLRIRCRKPAEEKDLLVWWKPAAKPSAGGIFL